MLGSPDGVSGGLQWVLEVIVVEVKETLGTSVKHAVHQVLGLRALHGVATGTPLAKLLHTKEKHRI